MNINKLLRGKGINQVLIKMTKKQLEQAALSIDHALLAGSLVHKYWHDTAKSWSQSKNNQIYFVKPQTYGQEPEEVVRGIPTALSKPIDDGHFPNNTPVLWLAMDRKREVIRHVSHFHGSMHARHALLLQHSVIRAKFYHELIRVQMTNSQAQKN